MKSRMTIAASILLASAGAWGQSSNFNIAGYDIEGNTLLPTPVVQEIAAKWVGSDKTIDDINAAADAIRKAYETAGYPVVNVFPPVQSLENGRVKLKVIEGQIKRIQVKGNQAYGEQNIRQSLPPLQESTKPQTPKLVAAIAAANENPAKQVAVDFQAAEELGQIDAVVNVVEDKPEKFTLGVDNMGAKSTGYNRLTAGYQNANLFDRDHMLSLQAGTSLDHPSRSQQVSAGYRVPFYEHGLSLDAIAAVSHSTSTTSVGFGSTQFTGKGYTLGLRLNQALSSLGAYRHRLIYGFDYKDFDNNCTGVNEGTCGSVTAMPLSLAYLGSWNTPEIQSTATLSYAANLPGGPRGSQAEYQAARAEANQKWQALRASTQLTLPLPADLQFRIAFNGQYTQDRLVPGEQFGLGGANSVRGYLERSLSGDSGYNLGFELYSPELGKYLGNNFSTRALVFYDFGQIRYHHPIGSNESPRTLASIGTGLRLGYGRDLSLRLDVGFARKELPAPANTGIAREKGDANAHATVYYQF